jgi:hypothetical protein
VCGQQKKCAGKGETHTRAHIDEQDEATYDGQCLEEVVSADSNNQHLMSQLEYKGNILEEIPLRVRRVHSPPVVREYVEYTQNDNEEDCGPLGFETNGYHTTGSETEEGDKHTCDAPSPLHDKPKEQEDEEDATGE